MSSSKPAGYLFLTEKYKVRAIPHCHTSFIAESNSDHQAFKDETAQALYPASLWPGENDCAHLEFALKYDGISLALLDTLFHHIDPGELAGFIAARPVGKNRRRLWFLYEFLTGTRLPLADSANGNYIDLLDPDEFYAINNGVRSRRHRVIDNLPGTREFCPLVRRTGKLREAETADFTGECKRMVSRYPAAIVRRAMTYLYSKETKSSFEIEHIKPNPSRTEKFIGLLELAEHRDFCEKSLLIELQNRIVDPRFVDSDYRLYQNYVGETISFQKEVIHYVCPKPEDVPSLMAGLEASHRKMSLGAIPPVVHAAAIAYGFVFIHPFEDGNGRIHRFLIHNILAMSGFTPAGLMIPVSAVMLKKQIAYDQSLEAFSRPLLRVIDYTLDDMGKMAVQNETARWYRYTDMTAQVEALLDFISETISRELAEELDFLVHYDTAKRAIQAILDLPDRQIDLFINCCMQNNGRLSRQKRESLFSKLTESEIVEMEEAVRSTLL